MMMNFKSINKSRLPLSSLSGYFFLILIIFLFLRNAIPYKFIQDDAYTSMRYAENFVNGAGLVFNHGEKVEGYTNFLWVILLSGYRILQNVFSIGNVSLENAASFLSLFFAIVSLILTYILAEVINKSETGKDSPLDKFLKMIKQLLPLLLLAYSTPLIYWGVSGMETTLFLSLVILSAILFLKKRDRHRPGYLFAFVCMLNSFVRPEGAIIYALYLAWELGSEYYLLRKGKEKISLPRLLNKKIIAETSLFILPLILYTLFRLSYYGYPLPNTFYAKTEFSFRFLERGIAYASAFAKDFLFYGLFLLPVVTMSARKTMTDKNLFLLFVSLSWSGMIIILGGDVLPLHRFFLPVLPFFYILTVESIFQAINIYNEKNVKLSGMLQLIVAGLLIFYAFANYGRVLGEMDEKRGFEAGLVKKMKIYSAWLNSKEDKKAAVALSTIGAFSYSTNADIIDIVGLTDKFISHNPKEIKGIDEELPVIWKERHYNSDYVMDRKPDYIIFPAGAKPSAFAECALFIHPEFRKNYYTQIFYSDELRQMLPVFTRKENVRKLNEMENNAGSFLRHYINAGNLFLKMTEKKDTTLLMQVVFECREAEKSSPQFISESETLIGMALFHAGRKNDAEEYFRRAIESDESNSMALYYLFRTYISSGKNEKALSLMPAIMKYSPDIFPSLSAKEK